MSDDEIQPNRDLQSADPFQTTHASHPNLSSAVSSLQPANQGDLVVDETDSDRGTEDVKQFIAEFCEKHNLPQVTGNTAVECECNTLADEAREEYKKRRQVFKMEKSSALNPASSSASPVLSSMGSFPSYSNPSTANRDESFVAHKSSSAITTGTAFIENKDREQASKKINAKKYMKRLRNNRRSAHAAKVHKEVLSRALSARITELTKGQKHSSITTALERQHASQPPSSVPGVGEAMNLSHSNAEFMLTAPIATTARSTRALESNPSQRFATNQPSISIPGTAPATGRTEVQYSAHAASGELYCPSSASFPLNSPQRFDLQPHISHAKQGPSFSRFQGSVVSDPVSMSALLHLQEENKRLKGILEQHGLQCRMSNMLANLPIASFAPALDSHQEAHSHNETEETDHTGTQRAGAWDGTFSSSQPIPIDSTQVYPEIAHLRDIHHFQSNFVEQPLTTTCDTQLAGTGSAHQHHSEATNNEEDTL